MTDKEITEWEKEIIEKICFEVCKECGGPNAKNDKCVYLIGTIDLIKQEIKEAVNEARVEWSSGFDNIKDIFKKRGIKE